MSFSKKESKSTIQGSNIEDALNRMFEEADKMKDGIDYDYLRQTLSKVTEGMEEAEQPEKPRNPRLVPDSGTIPADVPIHNRNVAQKKSKDLAANLTVQSDKIMKGPVCLIENIVENGKLKLVPNPEGLNILSKIQQPVVVVSIVGLYRTGKSYLMNKLAGAKKGFSIGSTVQSQTKGIWMWCVPHPTLNDHILVLLDTEGLGDVEKGDDKNDAWLFSLAVLLSSVLVYNSRGTIDQDALDKLKFVMEISEMIKLKSNTDENDEDEFSKYFPSFVWTVRDFTLQLKIDGEEISENEYMENALKLKQSTGGKKLSRKERDFNDLRENIRKFFGKRKCFVFDMPTADNTLLHHLADVPESELSAGFVAQTKNFCDYIFKNAEVKRLALTVPVTGNRFGELAVIYAKAVNSSKVACMDEAVVSLAEKENKAAIQEAIQHYENKMKQAKLPTETLDDLMTLSSQCEEEARQMFLKRSFKDDKQQFIKTFMENMGKKRNEFISINEEKSQEICVALIKKLSMQFEKSLNEGTYNVPGGHELYKKDMKDIEGKYNREVGKGVKAEEVLQEYVKSKQGTEITIIMADNTMTQKEKEKEEEKARKLMKDMEAKLKKMQEDQEKLKVQQENNALQETIKQLMVKIDEDRRIMDEKLQQVMKEKEAERQRYMEEGFKQRAADLQKEVDDLKKKVNGTCVIS